MNTNVTISVESRALAEKRAREEGFQSVDEYVDTLIREDGQASSVRGWLRERIEEGLRSPSAGELTREKFDRLVSEGMARAKAQK